MTQYVSDLQALADQWGDAFSASYGTTCAWVDLHATHPDMDQYQKYKITAKTANVRYEGDGTAVDMPGIIVTDTSTNNTSVEQRSLFRQSKTTTTSFTWTMKEAIKVGVQLSFKVGVPPVASATTTITTEISVESTQSSTKTDTETWDITRNVTVPPYTRMDMTWTITEKASSATYYCDVILTGYFAIWNNDKIDVNNPGGSDKHWLWFIPVVHAFNDMRDFGIHVPSLYTIRSGNVTYKASGECNGESGYNTTFNLTETPLTAAVKGQVIRSRKRVQKGVPAIED